MVHEHVSMKLKMNLVVVLPVYIALLVDGVDGKHHLRHVKFGHVLRESVLKLTKQSQQVTAHVIIHHQVLWEEKIVSYHTNTDSALDIFN